jgi:DNA-binding transcriptional MerR regulator
LQFIVRARRLGFSLAEVREILSAFDEGETVCETTQQVLLRKQKEIQRAIQDLKALDEQILELLKRCKNSFARVSRICPVIESEAEPLARPPRRKS